MIKIAQVLGLFGGIGGTLLTSLIIIVTRASRILARVSVGRLIAGISIWSYVVFIFAVIGIIGAALVRSKPKAGGILMGTSGLGGLMAVTVMILITHRVSGVDFVEGTFSILLLICGILGIISGSRHQPQIDFEQKPTNQV